MDCTEQNRKKYKTLVYKAMTDDGQPDSVIINQAAHLIKSGEVVAFPTETVYGLGANALDRQAIDKIFAAKGRPSDNPLIVHIAEKEQIKWIAAEFSPEAQLLTDKFWPGPLTIILPRSEKIPDRVTAGLDTVAVRMPLHPVALALIKASGTPIAAPSANTSGKPSPTKAEHVAWDMVGKIRMILDGGDTCVGLESTVLDLTCSPPQILRPGGVTAEQLKEVLGEIKIAAEVSSQQNRPRSPGMKYTHYKPEADLIIVQGDLRQIAAKIKQLRTIYEQQGCKVGIMATEENLDQYSGDNVLLMGSRSNPEKIAAGIYDILRQFDKTDVKIILAEGLSREGIGLAIMNRLSKASGYNIISCD